MAKKNYAVTIQFELDESLGRLMIVRLLKKLIDWCLDMNLPMTVQTEVQNEFGDWEDLPRG